MIGLQYTITNKNGDSITLNDHATNPNQVIALQSYPSFDIDIKNNEVDREGQHGIWDFYSYYGRRVVSFSGVIVGETEADVEAVKNQLITVLSLPLQPTAERDGTVMLTWTDVLGEDWQIEAKLLRDIQFSREMKQTFRLDFNFSLKAASPFIESQNLATIFGVRGYVSAGAMFPITLPALLGTDDVNLLQITNEGSMSAHTVIRIYGETLGAITNPKIVNRTTGAEFLLSSTIADETEWIEIDSKEGTVVDQSGADLSGDILAGSDFITLEQGLNELIYLSDEDPLIVLYLPEASWSVSYRNTKI